MNQFQSVYDKMLIKVKQNRLKHAQKILRQKFIEHDGRKMRFQYFIHGQRPGDGYRLVFGCHGGGGCPSAVNQQQWNNHKHLYDGLLPPGTIWFVPRSAEQASDMWWKDYIPQFFTLIVQCFGCMNMIDMNRVFITGYSAGGDGIYHVASMMADVLAGAAMMAGHPNKAEVYNLRNLAFSVQVGQLDHAYDRANWGKVYIDKINQYATQYGGFKQFSLVHARTQHWMGKQDAKVFPKLLNQVRQPYPQFILFKQHPRTFKKTFYYIKIQQKHNGLIVVRRKGNKFQIQSDELIPITMMLNSYFIDFSLEVQIYHNGQLTVRRKPVKSQKVVLQTIEEFLDPWYIFQDQFISLPEVNLPKDHKILRPFQIENHLSSAKKIKQMESQIEQDQNLHVSFSTKKKWTIHKKEQSIKSQKPLSERQKKQTNTHQIIHSNGNQHPSNSLSQKIKKLQQSCQKKCQIY